MRFVWVSLLVLGAPTEALSSVRVARGSAATPAAKKKVAVVGSGGYLGAVTFGFLQRAASLYGTGIGNCRCIGATPDTAVRLNRILSKHFCLAQADESYIKLVNLESIDDIASRLQGWDALILGSDLFLEKRPVGAGSYETTPNDKAWEVYWDEPKGAFADLSLTDEAREAKNRLLQNLLSGAKLAQIQHLIVVDNGSLLPQLESCGVPYTCIRTPNLMDTKEYTFKNGVVQDLTISPWTGHRSDDVVCREDLAALCVQCLLSLSWDTSRQLTITSNGLVQQPAVLVASRPNSQRVDQQWCVNSFLLQDKLSTIS